jgi:hypothetical protein
VEISIQWRKVNLKITSVLKQSFHWPFTDFTVCILLCVTRKIYNWAVFYITVVLKETNRHYQSTIHNTYINTHTQTPLNRQLRQSRDSIITTPLRGTVYILTHSLTHGAEPFLRSCQLCSQELVASEKLQNHLNVLQQWLCKWKIKVNNNKSLQIMFTTRPTECPPVMLNDEPIPMKNEVKYLGLHHDRRLTWKAHTKTKKQQLKIKTKQMNWLIGRKSQLSLENKLLIYKVILKSIWTYGIELWGCVKPSNFKINPCGGGVQYLHRDPVSRQRRRNGTKKGRAIA